MVIWGLPLPISTLQAKCRLMFSFLRENSTIPRCFCCEVNTKAFFDEVDDDKNGLIGKVGELQISRSQKKKQAKMLRHRIHGTSLVYLPT